MLAAAVLASVVWAQAGMPPMDVPAAPAPATPASSTSPSSSPFGPAPVELRWQAPAGCPGVEAVRAGIMRGLPSPSPGVTMAPVAAEVVVTAIDGGPWRAALALRGADWTATRTLRGPTCAAVADAAELVIDLAVATELQSREAAPPRAVRPPAPPPSTPVVGLAALGDAGTLPALAAGAGVVLGWRFARARIDVRGGWFATRAGTVAAAPDVGARVGLLSASLRACGLAGDRVAVGACADAGLDRLSATGFGAITPERKTNLAPFLGGGLEAEWRASRRVVPFLTVEAAIPLVRAQISIEDVGPVHRVPAISFRGAAGVEVRFR
jgi:hypothetical protein